MSTSAVALVDTSALLALAAPRDQHHDKAVAIVRKFLSGSGRLVGTTLILGELHGLALQRQGPEAARTVLSRLFQDAVYQWIGVPLELVREAAATWLERFRDQRFSLTDAVSFEVMRRERIDTAFAFDRHFVTAGFELLA